MSTIVVIKKGADAVMASDSLSSYGSTLLRAQYDVNPTKIFKVKNTYFGVVGSAAHCLVLDDLLSTTEEVLEFSSVKEVFKSFRKMHPILKKEYYMMTEEEDEQPYESSQIDALLLNVNGIFGVHSFREVYQYQRFWATGSGWRYALGAMCALYESEASAAEIAREAIRAACEFDQGSELPCDLYSLDGGVAVSTLHI